MTLLNSIESNLFSDSQIENLLNDLQFGNRFTGVMTSPSVAGDLFDVSEDSFRIKSFNIPNTSIDTEYRNYNGKATRVARSKTYDSFNITFYDNEMGRLREKFHKWAELIFDKESGKLGYYKEYISHVFTLNILSTEDKSINSNVNFYEVYPVAITDIIFDRGSKNMVIEFSVTFAYKKVEFVNNNKKENRVNTFIEKLSNTF